MTNMVETFSFDIDFIGQLTEFCLHEIALEGLQGCRITEIFDLLYKSSNSILIPTQSTTDTDSSNLLKINKFFSITNSTNSPEVNSYKNFLWKILLNQYELDFYTERDANTNKTVSKQIRTTKKSTKNSYTSSLAASKKPNTKLLNIISNQESRGYCPNYSNRICVNNQIKPEDNINRIRHFSLLNNKSNRSSKTFVDCLNEFDSNLIVVANQQYRNKVLCPSYKCLDFENLNDMEYCVLEQIAKSRYQGIYSTGEDGLTELFDLVPKQLHYIVGILESHQLVKKQSFSSEKKRSVIHLTRYAYKKRTIIEDLCEYLLMKHIKEKKNAKNKTDVGYYDTFGNIRNKLGIGIKKFKTTVQSAEKQNIVKRQFIDMKCKLKKNKNSSFSKTKPVKVVMLTDSYFKSMLNDSEFNKLNNCFDSDECVNNSNFLEQNFLNDNSLTDDCSVNNDEAINSDSDTFSLTSEFVKENLGANQSYLTPLYTQFFCKINSHGKEGVSLKKLGTLFGLDFYKSRRMGTNLQAHSDIVTIIKETSRMRAKYQTVMLRKYLQAAEVKTLKEFQADNNSSNELNTIDSTLTKDTSQPNSDTNHLSNFSPEIVIGIVKRDGQTKTNIQALISNRAIARKKLILDYIEKHRICTKYELTKEIRTYETQMELKGSIDAKTTKRMLITLEKENKLSLFEVNLKNQSYMCVRSKDISESDPLYINYCSTFRRTFDSVDSKFKTDFDNGNSSTTKMLIPRSATGSLYPSKDDKSHKNTIETPSKTKEIELDDNLNKDDEDHSKDLDLTRAFIKSVVDKLKFSTRFSKTYSLVPKFQKLIILHRFLTYVLYFNNNRQESNSDESTTWKTNIPALNRPKATNKFEDGCIFISEIFSHMPLSVFCSIIVINFQVPGLLALLKDEKKRHILVKDLPPSIIAPLIFERRYLQRLLSILQLLGCLGLITFVESPCKKNQPINRDLQSQMIYVHTKAVFYDTSTNKAKDWSQLKQINKNIFKSSIDTAIQSAKEYEKFLFEFTKAEENVVDYWRKLMHISMNTYKFFVGKYLHESKNLRQALLSRITSKSNMENIVDLWPIEKYGDHMGPGGYDSQLFLHSLKNWILPTYVMGNTDANQSDQSDHDEEASSTPAITKEDQLIAPFSELALNFPFGVFHSIQHLSKKNRRRASKRKLDDDDSMDDSEDEASTNEAKAEANKITSKKAKANNEQKLNNQIAKQSNQIKLQKAKTLLDKSKVLKAKTILTRPKPILPPPIINEKENENDIERRATWNSDEDQMILLIKVTSLFFMPNEKSIPCKLISEIMNLLMPEKSLLDKKPSSYGRRVKILMRSKRSYFFVSSKLELCKQNKELEKKYSPYRARLKRQYYDQEQVELYVRFIKEIQDKLLKTRSYADEYDSVEECNMELPSTLEEFHNKFIIKNSSNNPLSKKPHYQHPTNDYEISCNTVHSAIHSSILKNFKNPRSFEAENVFEKYSSHLLNDVISRMSNQHKIIAPTKYHELKKKNVTAFSKHINKAYHISQRYNYKWIMNTISSNVLNETVKFKDNLVDFKQKLDKTELKVDSEMFDCTDKDDLGMTSFLAHTLDNSDLQVQIDVPNKIWFSKLI